MATTRFASVTCARLSVPLHTPFVTALRRTTTTDTVVVRVTDSDGATGWGEAPQVWQVTGESLAGATACLEQMLAPVVVDRDVDDWSEVLAGVQSAVARNFGAKAALDTAVRDLVARRAGLTLPAFLRTDGAGPATGTGDDAYPAALRTDVTLSAAGSAADLAAAAVQRVADGFSTLKMKVGTDAATDVARVRAVREAVGPDVTIRLDANQGWTPDEAVTRHPGPRARRPRRRAGRAAGPGRGRRGAGRRAVQGRAPDHGRRGALQPGRPGPDHPAGGRRPRQRQAGQMWLARRGPGAARRATEAGLGTMVGSMMETAIGVGAVAAVAPRTRPAWWTTSTPRGGGPRRRSSGESSTTVTGWSSPRRSGQGSRRSM